MSVKQIDYNTSRLALLRCALHDSTGAAGAEKALVLSLLLTLLWTVAWRIIRGSEMTASCIGQLLSGNVSSCQPQPGRAVRAAGVAAAQHPGGQAAGRGGWSDEPNQPRPAKPGMALSPPMQRPGIPRSPAWVPIGAASPGLGQAAAPMARAFAVSSPLTATAPIPRVASAEVQPVTQAGKSAPGLQPAVLTTAPSDPDTRPSPPREDSLPRFQWLPTNRPVLPSLQFEQPPARPPASGSAPRSSGAPSAEAVARNIAEGTREWRAADRGVQGHFDRDPDSGLARYLEFRPLYAKKGIANPAKWIRENIISVRFMGYNVNVHRKFAAALSRAEEKLKQQGIILVAQPGSFNPKVVSGSRNKLDKELSLHALGLALDYKAKYNPMIKGAGLIRSIEILTGVNLGVRQSERTSRAVSERMKSIDIDKWISAQQAVLRGLRAAKKIAEHTEIIKRTMQNINLVKTNYKTLRKCTRLGLIDLPSGLISAMKKSGIRWGGDFVDLKDYMHFDLPNVPLP